MMSGSTTSVFTVLLLGTAPDYITFCYYEAHDGFTDANYYFLTPDNICVFNL